MKNIKNKICSLLLLFITIGVWSQKNVNSRIDNWRYWEEKAEQGLVPFNSDEDPIPAISLDYENNAGNTPDVVLITGTGVSQSENSIFVNPIDNQIAINSNNSVASGQVLGANALFSFDGGNNWIGDVNGVGGNNKGDPATAINLQGTSYIGYIANDGGQGISISNDNGTTWNASVIANGNSGFLDKNHLWIDNSMISPFEGNLYSAWTRFDSGKNIEISRSTNNGTTWSTPISISNNIFAGSHNQGVNIQTGPNGQVYAVWAIYDSWPARENALGFARSTDGGITFEPAVRINNNIQGVRWQPSFPSSLPNPHGKNMRTNSFPSMAVDISGGNNDGNIYVVWTNIGEPGNNTGIDVSIYLIKSTDNGITWSVPTRVNQDTIGNVQYFPWITCDPVTGGVSVIFYDDRNTSDTNVEVWVANSTDGGTTWDDFRVSDVSFTPAPIPGLAGGYMGDYLGISARDGLVFPIWTDNRSGATLAYTSPFSLFSDCENHLSITTNVNNGVTDIQEAQNTITATNTIFSGGIAKYKAGTQVILEAGFHSRNGSSFLANIGNCSSNKASPTNIEQKLVKAPKPKTIEYFKESEQDIKLKIYPNPTKDIFNIKLKNNNLNNFNIKIYSLSKGLMYVNQFHKENINSFQVDISQFPKGHYFIKLINTNKKLTFTGKIIKN